MNPLFLHRGNALCVQDADFGRFGVCICWDMQFPEVARTLALRGAQLVVCPHLGVGGRLIWPCPRL